MPKRTIVPIFSKPIKMTNEVEWFSKNFDVHSQTERTIWKSFNIRQEARQSKDESTVTKYYDNLASSNRLDERAFELERVLLQEKVLIRRLQIAREKMTRERKLMTDLLEFVTKDLVLLSNNLNKRNNRRHLELVLDTVLAELKKEVKVTQTCQKTLEETLESTWNCLNSLDKVKFPTALNIKSKEEAMKTDLHMIAINESAASITLKDLKNEGYHSYEEWLETTNVLIRTVTHGIEDANSLREKSEDARRMVKNLILAQIEATEYTMRKRIHEMKNERDNLVYQHGQIKRFILSLEDDTDKITNFLISNTNGRKLTETRLSLRTYRPDIENILDAADAALKYQNLSNRNIRLEIDKHFHCLRVSRNELDLHFARIETRLRDLEEAIAIDEDVLKSRGEMKLLPTIAIGYSTQRNLTLANVLYYENPSDFV